MGNSSSHLTSRHSNNSDTYLDSPDKKSPFTPTDQYTIRNGLTMLHAGWRITRRSPSASASELTAPAPSANINAAPPPPYTASVSSQPAASTASTTPVSATTTAAPRNTDAEDALELLRKYNVVFVVDDSISMGFSSDNGTRWEEAGRALSSIAEVAAKYDMDGIDIHFLNNKPIRGHTNLRTSAAVRSLFSSLSLKSSTPIGEKLEELLLSYMDSLEAAQANGGRKAVSAIKPVNFITITDGHPTDDPESVIVAAAKRLDAGKFPLCQVGIQFVQIGNSRSAKRYLEELDDHLHTQHGIRDIVDTTPYNGRELDADSLVKILLGGINRRVDREHSI